MQYEEKLQTIFHEFARDTGSALKKATGGEETMNLGELVSMLKEAQVLDSKCTAREVTTFFVMVNIDDELYVNAARSRGDSSAELCFDEFWEVSVRICKEKLPEIKEGDSVWSTFEQSLEAWIGLEYLPRLNAALKKRNKSGGAT